MLLYSHLQFITSPWRGEADADAEGIGRGGEPLTIKYHPTPAAFAADPPPPGEGLTQGDLAVSMKRFFVIATLTAALTISFTPSTRAQQTSPIAEPSLTTPPASPSVRSAHRIVINPRPLLYRRCIDWYELQHRPSGTVLYPQMHCWWVRG
jgi:hypothetical protein